MPKIDLFPKDKFKDKDKFVMLTLTQDCNLRCRYCYEPNKSRDYWMDIKTAQQAVTNFMNEENEFTGVEFDFFGGEPLLAFDLMQFSGLVSFKNMEKRTYILYLYEWHNTN